LLNDKQRLVKEQLSETENRMHSSDNMTKRMTYGQEVLTKEIEEIAAVVSNQLTEEMKEKAKRIAFDYFGRNVDIDPQTLARASFYIALKEYKCKAEKSVNTLISNNGKQNHWWLYVVPLVEKSIGRK
jgi:hypothetical protein